MFIFYSYYGLITIIDNNKSLLTSIKISLMNRGSFKGINEGNENYNKSLRQQRRWAIPAGTSIASLKVYENITPEEVDNLNLKDLAKVAEYFGVPHYGHRKCEIIDRVNDVIRGLRKGQNYSSSYSSYLEDPFINSYNIDALSALSNTQLRDLANLIGINIDNLSRQGLIERLTAILNIEEVDPLSSYINSDEEEEESYRREMASIPKRIIPSTQAGSRMGIHYISVNEVDNLTLGELRNLAEVYDLNPTLNKNELIRDIKDYIRSYRSPRSLQYTSTSTPLSY